MSEWDATSEMPKRKLANTEITLYLETMRTRAFEVFMVLTRQGEVIEPARVEALMFGRDPEGERKTLSCVVGMGVTLRPFEGRPPRQAQRLELVGQCAGSSTSPDHRERPFSHECGSLRCRCTVW